MEWFVFLLSCLACGLLVVLVLLVMPRVCRRRTRKLCETEFGVRLPGLFECKRMKGHDRYCLSWNGHESFVRIHDCMVVCQNPILLIFLVQILRKKGKSVPLCHDEYLRMKKLSKRDKLSSCYLKPHDACGHYDINEFTQLYNDALSVYTSIKLI